jgi:L-ribulose-5-phosphate 4-epimerase
VWTAGSLSQRIPGEDVARTVHVTRQLGEPLLIAPEDSDALFERYQNVYGQR